MYGVWLSILSYKSNILTCVKLLILMRTLMATVLSFYARRQLILIFSATFDFKNAVTLKTGLGVCQKSLEISPFDRAHKISYWRSIVTMALSFKVIENGIIR